MLGDKHSTKVELKTVAARWVPENRQLAKVVSTNPYPSSRTNVFPFVGPQEGVTLYNAVSPRYVKGTSTESTEPSPII